MLKLSVRCVEKRGTCCLKSCIISYLDSTLLPQAAHNPTAFHAFHPIWRNYLYIEVLFVVGGLTRTTSRAFRVGSKQRESNFHQEIYTKCFSFGFFFTRYDIPFTGDTSSMARFLRNQQVFYIPIPVPQDIMYLGSTPKYSTGM